MSLGGVALDDEGKVYIYVHSCGGTDYTHKFLSDRLPTWFYVTRPEVWSVFHVPSPTVTRDELWSEIHNYVTPDNILLVSKVCDVADDDKLLLFEYGSDSIRFRMTTQYLCPRVSVSERLVSIQNIIDGYVSSIMFNTGRWGEMSSDGEYLTFEILDTSVQLPLRNCIEGLKSFKAALSTL
jgi:hypothetical protein